MKASMSKKLIDKYPKLYKDNLIDNTPFILFGFEHGAGWYDIIDKLSEKIYNFDVKVIQVKEKFGGLRYYVDVYEDKETAKEIYKWIHEAEDESYITCELCGAKNATQTRGGWIRTLCGACMKE